MNYNRMKWTLWLSTSELCGFALIFILLMDEAKNMSDQFDSKLHCRKGKTALAHYLYDLHSLGNNRWNSVYNFDKHTVQNQRHLYQCRQRMYTKKSSRSSSQWVSRDRYFYHPRQNTACFHFRWLFKNTCVLFRLSEFSGIGWINHF